MLFRRRAFTIVELLIGLVIIGIVSTILIAVSRSVQRHSLGTQTRAQLTIIANALETYRLQFGDYPQTADSAQLLQSLIGKRGPSGAQIAAPATLDLSKLATANATDPYTDSTAQLIDAWSHPYRYAYKTSSGWKNTSYVLLSAGADGVIASELPADGILTLEFSNATDNTGAGNPDNIQPGNR